MFLLAWIILFAGLFLFFYYYDKSDSTVYAANHSEYILSADKNGHYRIQGRINEFPVEFLVDTGATYVAIPENVANRLNIKGRYPLTISTANGQITGSLTRLQKLSFGSFELNDIKAVIIPGDDKDTVLLGMNVLSQFNIAQEENRLVLRRRVK
ncbi:TIGR02281 family clan AA aspartic protease [Legionella worsleiensis]|uniref:Aspartyl protease n=2 Tax=Legionella worsleiensis TaxID=45076 RepID=A0A0W1AJ78_9GAMM|nr:aspartyl protease [Legionella worsleiensis]STY30771.1 Aspartyl protease [Legionella worsleiensis]